MSIDYDVEDVSAIKRRAEEALKVIYKTRVDELVDKYGSYRKAGEALKIDHAYLSRLANGEKKNPSDKVLKKLGLS